MDIPKIIKEHHQAMIDKGFYDCPECEGEGYYGSQPIQTCSTCNGSRIDPNKNIGELLMLIVSELGEALEAHRKGEMNCDIDDIFENITSSNPILSNAGLKQMELYKSFFPFEIADVFLRLFDLCGYLEIQPKEYPLLEMQCFNNIGQEFLWVTGMLANLPGFKSYYDAIDDISKEVESISLVIKRLERFCESKDIPIEKHILAKMAYNKTRPHKHGKEY